MQMFELDPDSSGMVMILDEFLRQQLQQEQLWVGSASHDPSLSTISPSWSREARDSLLELASGQLGGDAGRISLRSFRQLRHGRQVGLPEHDLVSFRVAVRLKRHLRGGGGDSLLGQLLGQVLPAELDRFIRVSLARFARQLAISWTEQSYSVGMDTPAMPSFCVERVVSSSLPGESVSPHWLGALAAGLLSWEKGLLTSHVQQ